MLTGISCVCFLASLSSNESFSLRQQLPCQVSNSNIKEGLELGS